MKAHAHIAVAMALICGVHTAPTPSQEIKHLPGWDGALPSKAYAGYLGAGNDSQDGVVSQAVLPLLAASSGVVDSAVEQQGTSTASIICGRHRTPPSDAKQH